MNIKWAETHNAMAFGRGCVTFLSYSLETTVSTSLPR